IISRNLGRIYENSVLPFIRGFYAAVKEKGYMGVFFSLRDSGLGHIMGCQELSESIRDRYLLEGNLLIWNGNIILSKAYIGYLPAGSSFKSAEIIAAEGTGNLSCPVRTEIKED